MQDNTENTATETVQENTQEQTQAQAQTTDYSELLQGVNMDELFKQEAVAKRVQSIADSRVSQALATAKSKWEKEQAQAQDEATKLSKMSEAEKAQYQFQKDKAAFEAEKAKFQHAQLQVETAKQLLQAGLPDLSTYITGKDAEETKANISAVATVLGAWKAESLKAAMAGTTPKDVTQASNKITTRAEIKSMKPDEIVRAYQEGRIDLKNIK